MKLELPTSLAVTLAALLAGPVAAQLPVGPEMQVNEITAGLQDGSRVAGTPDGGFVVAWFSFEPCDGIRARHFLANGEPAGSQSQVSSCSGAIKTTTDVFADEDGEFTIVWEEQNFTLPPGYLYGGSGRRFAADGDPLGDQFTVTPDLQSGQYLSADGAPTGEFVVARGVGTAISDSEYVRVLGFDESGLVQWDVFITPPAGHRYNSPDVDVSSTGDFVVAWRDLESSSSKILMRRFDADGTPLSKTIDVGANGWASRVVRNVAGDFLLVWGGSNQGIQARALSATGIPLGPQVRVDNTTIGRPGAASVAATSDGSFVVAWTDDPLGGPGGGDGSTQGIRARTVSANGALLSSAFLVNSFTTGAQTSPSVSSLANGDFVIAWSSEGSFGNDTSDESIQVRRFRLAFFADGFESGDISRWVLGED